METEGVTSSEKGGRGGGGRKAGAKGYKAVEIMKLLRIIEALQPVGTEGWRRVTNLYNKWAGDTGVSEREMENLRKKYKSLTRYKPEVGVTQIPEEVKEARRIERLILDRISGKEGVNAVNGPLFVDNDDHAEQVNDQMKIDGSSDEEGVNDRTRRRSGVTSMDYSYLKSTRNMENAVLSLVEKLDQQNKDFKDMQNMVRSFLDNQQSTLNALVQQNQQFMMILVQGQKGGPLYVNPHNQSNPPDGSAQ